MWTPFHAGLVYDEDQEMEFVRFPCPPIQTLDSFPFLSPPPSLQIYDPAWHSSLYEFLSDLWPAVGRAHAGQGSRLRGGGGLLSGRTQEEQRGLMDRAYAFAGVCWRAEDVRCARGVLPRWSADMSSMIMNSKYFWI